MENNASESGKAYLLKILPKVFSIGWIEDVPPIINYEDKCFTVNMKLLRRNDRDVNGRLFETIEDITFKVRFVASSIGAFIKHGFNYNDYRMLIPKNIFQSKCELVLVCYEVDKWYPCKGLKNKVRPVQSEYSEITLPTLIDIPSLSYNQEYLATCKNNCLALKIQNMPRIWGSIVAFEESIHLGCNVGDAMIKSFEKFNEEIKNGRGTPQWAKT